MAYSTPSSKTTGTLITAAIWNQDVVDNVAFLGNPPACRVYHTGAFPGPATINDNNEAAVAFDSERFDTDSMHSTSSNTTRITFNTAGLYIVTFTAALPSDTTYQRTYCHIKMNGTTTIAVGDSYAWPTGYNSAPFLNVTTVYKFATTNYVEAFIFQDNNTGAAKVPTATGNFTPEFAACWIGLG